MIFIFLFAFTAALMALGVGIIFIIWSIRREGAGIKPARFFGYFISILAALALLFTAIYGICYWSQGYFKSPIAPMMMMKKQMWDRKGMMMKDPRMMKLRIERMKQRMKNMQDRQQRLQQMVPPGEKQ